MPRLIVLLCLLCLCVEARGLDMPLTAADGRRTNLEAFLGKWVVVNYWATWCPPCIYEMPELQDFHDRHAERDAIVVGINAEAIGRQRLETFLDDYFITYPIFVAGPTQESELGTIPGLPTTFLVTPRGEVVARQVGPVTGDMLEQFIEKWAAERE